MELEIKNKTYQLPIFLPDATHASIKGLDTKILEQTGIRGLVTNTYHLLADEAVEIVQAAGGIKAFMNFSGLVITDSGGFQAMSLVRKNPSNGKLTEEGVVFKNPKNGKSLLLTPEICIETQIKLGSDIIMVLDDCTDPNEPLHEQEISVERTIRWAKRCKQTFNDLTKDVPLEQRPKIFGIIQGGNHKELRKKCAEELIKIDFDGYAYGGWPLMEKILLTDILEYTASLMPDDKPKYAMGVGKPEDMRLCVKMGYNMFDCVIVTRDARHGRLYNVTKDATATLNIGNHKYTLDFSPIHDNCTCHTCQNYTKAYLRHLYKAKEPTFSLLAMVHNLHNFAKTFE